VILTETNSRAFVVAAPLALRSNFKAIDLRGVARRTRLLLHAGERR
jgi:hypothetical protein